MSRLNPRSAWRLQLPKPTRDAAIYLTENGFRILMLGVTGVLIARKYGPGQFGLLSYATAIAGIAVSIASLGMRQILTRELATVQDWRQVLASAVSRQLLGGLILALASSALIVLTRPNVPEAKVIALALSPLPLLAVGDSYRALLEAKGRSSRIFRASLAATALSSTTKLVALILGAPIWVYAIAMTVEALVLVVGLTGVGVLKSWYSSLRKHYSSETARSLVQQSWPLLLSSVAVIIYMRLDAIMLGTMVGDHETGIYTAAARISEALYFVPVAAAAAFRPRLARLYVEEQLAYYDRLTGKFMRACWLGAICAVAVTALLAGWGVDLLYGPQFAEATPVLILHVLAAPFVFLGVASSQWLIDRGLTGSVLVRAAIGLALNAGLNLILIPSRGALGAALATLISYAISAYVSNAFGNNTRDLFRLQTRAIAFLRV